MPQSMAYRLDQEIIEKLDSMTQFQELTPRGRRNILSLLELLKGEYGVDL